MQSQPARAASVENRRERWLAVIAACMQAAAEKLDKGGAPVVCCEASFWVLRAPSTTSTWQSQTTTQAEAPCQVKPAAFAHMPIYLVVKVEQVGQVNLRQPQLVAAARLEVDGRVAGQDAAAKGAAHSACSTGVVSVVPSCSAIPHGFLRSSICQAYQAGPVGSSCGDHVLPGYSRC